MSQSENRKFWKRRTRSSYLSAVISIGVVLYFLGLFAGISLLGLDVLKKVEENLIMEVFLNDYISDSDRQELQQKLDSISYVREVVYVDKEEAAKKMNAIVGEEVQESLGGVNPYLASFQIKLQSSSLGMGKADSLKGFLSRQMVVADVAYQGDALPKLEENLRLFTYVSLLLGLLLSLMGVSLVYATIRLTIYARRLAIRSMELIGATRGFIRGPFLLRGSLQGMLGGLIAVALLAATLYLVWLQLEGMAIENIDLSPTPLIVLFGGIVLFGSALGFTGSYWAVNKYLNRNLDELL